MLRSIVEDELVVTGECIGGWVSVTGIGDDESATKLSAMASGTADDCIGEEASFTGKKADSTEVFVAELLSMDMIVRALGSDAWFVG